MAILTSRNPFTQEINRTGETLTDKEVIDLLDLAGASYLYRKTTSHETRQELFHRLADILERDIEKHARLETIEMGRSFHVAVAGLRNTVKLIRRNADHAGSILAPHTFDDQGTHGMIQYDPIGVIYGIAPRNFPYNQLLRAAVPNILAGNTVVYKHASNCPLCARGIQELFDEAGFPTGVYTNLAISSSQSEIIIAHHAVQGVNLTGSDHAGSVVGSLAGKYCKRSVLELGGNDAFVVLDHRDTDAMVTNASICRLSNNGQRCNSSKRFIVLDKYYDEFVNKLGKHFDGLTVGDPFDPQVVLGPLATRSLLEEVHTQVTQTITQGARLVTGGTIINHDQTLYSPTVLADVGPGMTSRDQEVFGPVASVCRSHSIEQSIDLANNSHFGLSAVVYGDDEMQCRDVAQKLEGGMIFVNQPAGSQTHLAFGGVKKSGYGKENGPDGLLSFTNKKVIMR